MAKTFRPDDLKKCDKCKSFFLPASCPLCDGAKWRWAIGLTLEIRQKFFEKCLNSTTKACLVDRRI